MWWNNVETRPGTGYPTGWEDQDHYEGGWKRDEKGRLHLRLQSKPTGLARLFFNPALPELDDYYEPFTFTYQDLFDAPAGEHQPTAKPISMITGDEMEIDAGPNWDDDLGGSGTYARNDPAMGDVDRMPGGNLLVLDSSIDLQMGGNVVYARMRELDPQADPQRVWALQTPPSYFAYRALPTSRLVGMAE